MHPSNPTCQPRSVGVRLFGLLIFVVVQTVCSPGAAEGAEESVPSGTWPLSPIPIVVTPFAPPPQPWLSGHRGVDLRATPGALVKTALAGRVSYVGSIAGIGIVSVDHGLWRTTYQPVVANVTEGDVLSQGAPIGSVDTTGSHCAPDSCLHWGLIHQPSGAYRDPLLLVRPITVRLLPWDSDAVPRGNRPRLAGPWTLPRAA